MANQFIITDGAKARNAKSILDSDDPTVWTFLSGQPKADDIKLYARVAAAFRAYNLKANTIANMPFAVMRGGEDFDVSAKWENKVGFMPNPSELFRLGVLSYMATNTIYNVRTSDVLGYKTKGLYHAVAYAFNPVTNPVTGELDHIERWVGSTIENYTPDDKRLVRLWRLDHTTEVLPSENTEARAIMKAAGEIYYADTWVENFYRRGGIRPTLIAMKGMISPDKKGEEENKWTQWLRGIGNWFTNIARVYNAEALDVKAFGDGVADLENNEVYRQAIANIALGTGMPLSLLLANSANYSTAKEEKATWYDSDIIPFCTWLSYEYNRQVFEPLGLRFEFRPETIDSEQEDETERAAAVSAFMDFVQKCPTFDVFMGTCETFGYELTDGLIAGAKAYYAEKEKQAEEMRNRLAEGGQQPENNNLFQTQNAQAGPVRRQQAPQYSQPQKALSINEYKELTVWRDVALRKHKRGESLDFEYEYHYGGLPDTMTADIKARLAKATDEDEIKSIFDIEPEPQSEIMVLAAALNKFAEKTA